MRAYFELHMDDAGRYFFTARGPAGQLLATSACFLTRRSALDGLHCLLFACTGGKALCFDRSRRAWQVVTPPAGYT